MAISHELSSEIAAALMAAKNRSPRELEDLKKTLLSVHTTLEELSDKERATHESQKARKKAAAGSPQ